LTSFALAGRSSLAGGDCGALASAGALSGSPLLARTVAVCELVVTAPLLGGFAAAAGPFCASLCGADDAEPLTLGEVVAFGGSAASAASLLAPAARCAGAADGVAAPAAAD
jgi:hypothetical protein